MRPTMVMPEPMVEIVSAGAGDRAGAGVSTGASERAGSGEAAGSSDSASRGADDRLNMSHHRLNMSHPSVLRPSFETPGWAYSGGQLYSGRSVLIKSILIGSHLGWGKMTVAGDEPIFVIMPGERDECGSQFFDCVEGPYPQ